MMSQQSTTPIGDDYDSLQEYLSTTTESPIDSPLPDSIIDFVVQFGQTTSKAHPPPIDQQFFQTPNSFIDQVPYYNDDVNNQQRFSINDDADYQGECCLLLINHR